MNATCPCCSEQLLRHARTGGSIYWFCSHCWQEMPNLNSTLAEKRASEVGIIERLVLGSSSVTTSLLPTVAVAALPNIVSNVVV
jgi:hypothetical protein